MTNIKKYGKAAGLIFIASIYLALVIKHFIGGQGMTYNPVTLIRDIPKTGFPFGAVMMIFIIIVCLALVIMKQNEMGIFRTDERNFKYSNSGVYGTGER